MQKIPEPVEEPRVRLPGQSKGDLLDRDSADGNRRNSLGPRRDSGIRPRSSQFAQDVRVTQKGRHQRRGWAGRFGRAPRTYIALPNIASVTRRRPRLERDAATSPAMSETPEESTAPRPPRPGDHGYRATEA